MSGTEQPDQADSRLPGSAYNALQQKPNTDAGFVNLYKLGADLDQIGPALMREFGSGKEDPVDPDYVVSEDDFEDFTRGLPESKWDEFHDVTSRADGLRKRARIKKEIEDEQTLSAAGWEGTAARLLANFTDPVAWGATAGTEGILGPALGAMKFGRAGRILYSAAVGAGENAAIEGYLASQSSSRSIHDVLAATAFGSVLGGGIGAVLPSAARGARLESEGAAGRGSIYKQPGPHAYDTMAADIGNRTLDERDAEIAAKATSDSEVVAAYRKKADDMEFAESRLRAAQADRESAREALVKTELNHAEKSPAREAAEAVAPNKSKSRTKVSGKFSDVGARARALGRLAEDMDPQAANEAQELMRRLTPGEKRISAVKADAVETEARERTQQIADTRKAQTDELRAKLAEAEDNLAKTQEAREAIKSDIAGLAERLPRDRDGNMVTTPEAVKRQAAGPEVAEVSLANDSANAARVHGSAVNESLTREDIELPQHLVEKLGHDPYASKARGSIYGVMGRSKSTWGRAINRLLHTDGVAGDSTRGIAVETSAADVSDRLNLYHGTQMMKTYLPAYQRWARGKDIGWFFRGQEKYRSEFAREVSHYMRSGEALSDSAREAGDAIRDTFGALLAEAKRLGIEGFADVEDSGHYFPRIWEAEQFVRFADDSRIGSEGLVRLVKKAILGASDDMDDAIATSIAEAVVTRFRRKGAGMDADFQRTLSGTDIDAVVKELSDTGLSRERLADVEDYLANKQRKSEGAAHPRAKRRIKMDEDASIELADGAPLRLTDLMQSDAEQVGMQYIRTVGGQIALARKLKQYGLSDRADGVINPERVLDKMIEKAKEEGIEEENLDRLSVSRNMLAGRPPTEGMNSRAAQALRIAKQLNFVRLMGQAGFAQIPEVGSIIGQTGLTTVLSQVPRLRGLLTRARSGDLNDELAREFEEYGAVFGVERMLYQPRLREEDFGAKASEQTSLGRGLNHAEQVLSKTSRAVADMSGMAGITITTQRLAATAMGQRFLKMALKPSAVHRQHMLSIGLDDDMLNRVLGQIRAHHVSEAGILVGRKLKRMNLDAWDDLEARDALAGALHKWGYRMVQRNMVGELPAFMHKEFGQLLTQFRSFVAVAYEKHLLHGINQKDRMAFASMVWSSFFAGLSYIAQTHLNAIGRDDKQRYLGERLSLSEIGKASFQRASYSSLLPGIIDTGLTLPGFVDRPVFAYGRTTGLATNFVSGIPSVDLANDAGRAVSGGLASINPARSDYHYSRKDWKALWSLIAFNNAIAMRNLGNSVSDNLPDQSVYQPKTLSDYFR